MTHLLTPHNSSSYVTYKASVSDIDFRCLAYSSLDILYPNDYIYYMPTVKTLPEFDNWLDGLKDSTTRLRLSRRLDKAQRGNLGDVKPVCAGVFEMREYTLAQAGECITPSAETP